MPLLFGTMMMTAFVSLSAATSAVSQLAQAPSHQQMIEHENARMKAAKERADAAKAAQLEAQKKAAKEGAREAAPKGSEVPN